MLPRGSRRSGGGAGGLRAIASVIVALRAFSPFSRKVVKASGSSSTRVPYCRYSLTSIPYSRGGSWVKPSSTLGALVGRSNRIPNTLSKLPDASERPKPSRSRTSLGVARSTARTEASLMACRSATSFCEKGEFRVSNLVVCGASRTLASMAAFLSSGRNRPAAISILAEAFTRMMRLAWAF